MHSYPLRRCVVPPEGCAGYCFELHIVLISKLLIQLRETYVWWLLLYLFLALESLVIELLMAARISLCPC